MTQTTDTREKRRDGAETAGSVVRSAGSDGGAEAGSASSAAGRVAIAWAVLGVVLLFGSAAWRLGRRGVETIVAGLGPLEWVILAVVTAAFVYGEGVRALERRYAPFVVGRARELGRRGTPLLFRVLAPLYAMSLVGARARAVARAWIGVALIVAAVLLVRASPEPWRGIIDFAVAAALVWGMWGVLHEAAITGTD